MLITNYIKLFICDSWFVYSYIYNTRIGKAKKQSKKKGATNNSGIKKITMIFFTFFMPFNAMYIYVYMWDGDKQNKQIIR